MIPLRAGNPSRTALAAAIHRATHQLIEAGSIFRDDLAMRILGDDAETLVRNSEQRPSSRRMRLFIAARHRFAEERITHAIRNGVRQVIVLGAGLDTLAYRLTHIEGVRVFEVDHPSTQAWKRESLDRAAIQVPSSLSFVPVDFEHESLTIALERAGCILSDPLFVSWLGVVPYLTDEAVDATFKSLASLNADVIFDYANPPESYSPEQRAAHEQRAARVAAIGESWQTYFDTSELHDRLVRLGFAIVDDYGPAEIAARIFKTQIPMLHRNGAHLLHARSRPA